MNIEFAEDVKKGFTAKNKYITDRQYYDDRGSIYFQELMANENYYPTNSEFEIFNTYKTEICNLLSENLNGELQLIEFGAGDGFKTKILIEELLNKNVNFTYYPIDYSEKYLVDLKNNFKQKYPKLKLEYINKDYFDALKDFDNNKNNRKVILFIGSSFGGLSDEEADVFLKSLYNLTNRDDFILFGLDLKKSPTILRKAYHETCESWCFYLLNRINKELDADINLRNFEYYTNYDPVSGEYKWYFLSKEKQTVNIKKINLTVEFDKWEPVYFSKSKKFGLSEIDGMLKKYNFKKVKQYFDAKDFFTNIIFEKKK